MIKHITALSIRNSNNHSCWVVHIRLLKAKKAFTIDFTKYFNYINIFSSEIIAEILKYNGINNYIIELEEDI